jgi:hypothetical protein
VRHLIYNGIHSVVPTNCPQGMCFSALLSTTYIGAYLGYNDISNHRFQYNHPRSRHTSELNHLLVLRKTSPLLFQVATKIPDLEIGNSNGNARFQPSVALSKRSSLFWDVMQRRLVATAVSWTAWD